MTFKEKQKTLFKRKKSLIEKATKAELYIQTLLKSADIRYIFQKGFIQGNNYCIVDFYIPRRKICLEIDGGYHQTKKQRKRDANRTAYLSDRGFSVICVQNEDAFKMTKEILKKILFSS